MDRAGVRRVVYTGDDEQLWDPYPNGEWIEDAPGGGGERAG
jgi:hypothetical protein